MDKLKEYIILLLEERAKIFSSISKNNLTFSMAPDILKANAITHGVNIILDLFEKEGMDLGFLSPEMQEERRMYKFMINNFNSDEVQEKIRPLLKDLKINLEGDKQEQVG